MPRLDPLIHFVHARAVSLLAVVTLMIYALTYTEQAFGPQIRADGEGYYAYLPAYLIDGDPTMETLAHRRYGGAMPKHTFWKRYEPTGRYVCVYNAGTALMAAPFFLVAHAATVLSVGQMDWQKFVHPADGYSFFYQHGAGLGGWFYFLLGIWVLKRELDRRFSPGVVLATLVALLGGTHLLHYASGETFSSHAASFLLVALLFPLSRAWHAAPSSRILSLGMGAWLGLAYLVRDTNVLAFVIFPLWGVRSWSELRGRVALYLRAWPSLLWMGAGLLLGLLPQLLIWHDATGHWWFSPRTAIAGNNGGLANIFRPALFDVVFGMRKGLLVYFPALALVVPGFFLLIRRRVDLAWGVTAYVALQLYVVSSYGSWDSGGGFGNRYFLEALIGAAFALAGCFQAVRRPLPRALLAFFVLACVGYTLFLMSLYYSREMSYYGMDRQAWFDFFWYRKQLLEAWLAR